mmetsp:Transcript_9887/g.22834  ORF Transcript_9887/g.22834 Transcript_9887/m.22834 type:complete len:268 (+) Transcript_9887:2607-3410(+)
MMKRLTLTLLLYSLSICYTWAQEIQENEQYSLEKESLPQMSPQPGEGSHLSEVETKLEKSPNYGSLMIDWGFNFLRSYPSEMRSTAWGARFVNIGLSYNIWLGHSHFTISPGTSLSFERFWLKNNYTLKRDAKSRYTVFKEEKNKKEIIASILDVRYLDILMLEIRFNANSKRPKESFFVALGGKVGIPWKTCITLEYKEDNEVKKCNHWETFNMNGLRYGAYTRLGWGRFGLCYTHLLSNLFNKDKGPVQTCKTQTSSLGISIDLF